MHKLYWHSFVRAYGEKRNIPREPARRALQNRLYPNKNYASHLGTFPRQLDDMLDDISVLKSIYFHCLIISYLKVYKFILE
jgi:hypothetical protein